MVKNKVGGNKAKKFARKNQGEQQINKKIRYSQDEDEVYGIVTKMIGNGQAHVKCNDSKVRLCFIRNKFSGRNKHGNFLKTMAWVLVGLRSWESKSNSRMEKCDLLEIYDDFEKSKIIQDGRVKIDVLIQEETLLSTCNNNEFIDSNIIFGNNESNTPLVNSEQVLEYEEEPEQNDEVIDFDDI